MEELTAEEIRKREEIDDKTLWMLGEDRSIDKEQRRNFILKCYSSIFYHNEIGIIISELMSRIEKQDYGFFIGSCKFFSTEIDEYESNDFKNIVTFAAVMNKFTLSRSYGEGLDENDFLRLKYIGNLEDFKKEYVEFFLEIKDLSLKSELDYLQMYYEPIEYSQIRSFNGDLYYDRTNIDPKRPYLQEFIRGLIKFRESQNGRILTKEEIHQLMEYYLTVYKSEPRFYAEAPRYTPLKDREVILRLK